MCKSVTILVSPVSAVRLAVLFVNHVWPTNAIWSRHLASTASNVITAAGKCAPRYDPELGAPNSKARPLLAELVYI
jgi:hypothetical protein